MILSKFDSKLLYQQRHHLIFVQGWRNSLSLSQPMDILNQFLDSLTMLQGMHLLLSTAYHLWEKMYCQWTWMSIQNYLECSFPQMLNLWFVKLKQRSKVHAMKSLHTCLMSQESCMWGLTQNGILVLACQVAQVQLHWCKLLSQKLYIC